MQNIKTHSKSVQTETNPIFPLTIKMQQNWITKIFFFKWEKKHF